MKTMRGVLAVLVIAGWAGSASSQTPITDAVTVDGIEWAQPADFTSLSWNAIFNVCGTGTCTGTLTSDSGTYTMDGWTWASVDEVNALFNSYIAAAGGTASGYPIVGPTYASELSSAWAPAFFEVFDTWQYPAPLGSFFGAGDVYGSTTDLYDTGRAWVSLVYNTSSNSLPDAMGTYVIIALAQEEASVGAWFYRIAEVPTPAGTDVQVEFGLGITVAFDSVISEGITKVAPFSEPPEGSPTSTAFEVNGKYFDVTTTAVFSESVELCFTYSDELLTLAEEENLRLMHFNEATAIWEDTTLAPNDTVNNRICGTTTHFSVFAVGSPYDTDNDGICDQDTEIVGVCDAGPDNCPLVSNADQADRNNDGVGNACDTDGDGVRNDIDNCVWFANPNQLDTNGNGRGDVCDSTPSGC